MAVVQRPLRGTWQKERRWLPPGWFGAFLLQMMASLLLLLALTLVVQYGMDITGRTFDNWRYGFPRTASIVGYVGHGDERLHPTWIQTVNLDGQLSVLVAPGSDVSQVQVLTGPYLFGSEGAYEVAHPALRDVNGDTHVDLLVTVRGEVLVYINENGQFRPLSAAERATLAEQGL